MKENGNQFLRAALRTACGALIAWAAWAGTTSVALAQNDNFADAMELTGMTGVATSDNTAYTAEVGEPNHAGVRATTSAWFKWTAPASGLVVFDTIGSGDFTNPRPAPLDTVLAVYTGSNGLAALNFVVGNDDFNTVGESSLVRFNAKAGQTYFITVDGWNGAEGPISLSWSYTAAGVFRFTSASDVFLCGELDGTTTGDPSTGQSVMGARVTVTRVGGAAGRALVDITTTDGSAIYANPAAVAGIDYNAVSATLAFDDWEMSKSVIIPVLYDQGNPSDPRVFTVNIAVNPDREGEPDYITPPRVDPAHSLATVGILDIDTDPNTGDLPDQTTGLNPPAPSMVNFDRPNYRVTENVGFAVFWVNRLPGDPTVATSCDWSLDGPINAPGSDNAFNLQAGSDYATPFPPTTSPPGVTEDFVGVNINNFTATMSGRLSWAAGDFNAKPIVVAIDPFAEDTQPEFNEDFTITLTPVQNCFGGNISQTSVTILYDDYPAGALDTSYNLDYNILSDPPYNTVPGANYSVNASALQPDGKCLLAGDFTTYNTIPRNRIARVNVDGSHDATFNPGSGANDYISCMTLVPANSVSAGYILIGGGFTSYNGQSRYHVARLNGDGSLDTAFNPGLGANGDVWAIAAQPDGKTLIGGMFTTVNGFSRPYLARLNVDGSVDMGFDTSLAPLNAPVEALAVSTVGTNVVIYVGGDFTSVGGISRNHIVRLNGDGSLDTTFDPRTGADGAVFTMALQPDGRLLIGGTFNTVDFRGRRNIARLNTDGKLDTTFNPGAGANDAVYTMTLQGDGRIYIGGQFTSVNQTRRVGLARLFSNGTVDTSFMDTAYNQFAGVQNPPYYTEGEYPQNAKRYILTLALQEDGNLIIGGKFQKVGGGRLNTAIQPRLDVEDTYSGFSRATYRNRENVARLIGGETVGAGNISLLSANYFIDESAQFVFVKALREKGTLGRLEAAFSVPEPGVGTAVAQPTTDYVYNGPNTRFETSWNSTRSLSDGIFGTNTISDTIIGSQTISASDDIVLTIPHRPGVQGNRTALIQFDVPSGSDVFYLGGEDIPVGGALGFQTSAELQINEVDNLPGVISFTSPTYQINEDATNAVITLIRTNGSAGTVSVIFNTTNGTAIAGIDYTGVTNTITFQQGVTNKTVLVPIKNNSFIQPDRTLKLIVRTPTGGALIGLGAADLTIVDEDYHPGKLSISASNYFAGEYSGSVRVTVNRLGGSVGLQDVDLVTVNGSAQAGVHYLATSNHLHWNSAESGARTVDIPLLPDGLVTSNLQFTVRLVNPSDPNALLYSSQTNAAVTIVNEDSYGDLQFSEPIYYVDETGGYVTITAVRVGGSAETISVNYSTADGTAVSSGPLPNYAGTAGTLVFGPGVVSQSFTVPILNDGVVNPAPFFFSVSLAGVTPAGAVLGSPVTAQVLITDMQTYNQPAGSADPAFDVGIGLNADVYALVLQPDGNLVAGGAFTTVNGLPRNRLTRMFPNGGEDTTFMNGLSGANDTIRAVLGLSDNRLMVGGYFTVFNGVNRNYLTRLNTDGTLDTTFDPGSGADAPVFALGEGFVKGVRKLYVGGSFTTFNGFARPGLVRLNDNGTVDSTFALTSGVNGPVYAIAIYATNTIHAGKVVIGGAFNTVNGVPRANIARLNPDGSLDTTFDPGAGADAEVRAVTLQLDGRVLLGGAFTHVRGEARNGVARLNGDGAMDYSFNIGAGTDGIVYSLALQADQRIVVGGDFTQASGVTRRRITRLMPDGTVDPAINFGSGANGFVAALTVQPDGRLLLGGGFTAINGQTQNHIARLFGGAMTGSGQIEFSAADYVVNENGTNAVITFRRVGGTAGLNPDGSGSVSLNFSTADNTAVAGVNYTAVNQPLSFPMGEVEASVVVPVQQDFQITSELTVDLALSGSAGLLGPQPIASLHIINVDSSVRFSAATYVRNEDAIDGVATITILREGSTAGTSTIEFATTTNGTAVAGVNYIPTNSTVVFLPGQTSQTVRIPVLHNPLAEADKTVTMMLTLPSDTILLSPNQAVLTIQNVDKAPGEFVFSAPAYFVNEGGGSATITILRTNGNTGIVSVYVETIPGSAVPGARYTATNTTLTFADGQVSRTFTVGIIDDNVVQGDQDLTIRLSAPTGGATIGTPSQVPLTIYDNDVALNFTSPAYVVGETNGIVLVGVQRLNGSNGVSTVTFRTVDGTAVAGVNYTADSRVLTFNPGETVKTLGIEIQRDPRVTGNLSFAVVLTNASAGVQLPPPNPATVTIVDVDPGISLTNSVFSIAEDATNLVVTVVRANPNSGGISVNYTTADGTATAGQDYTATSGTLTFLDGEAVKTILVPILDNKIPQSSRSFEISLFNPTGGAQLLDPSSATVTITDNDAGLHFSTDLYHVFENEVNATITVVRTNYTDSLVTVDYYTENGTAVAGADYTAASGTLIFTNGEISKSFNVGLRDDSLVQGDRIAYVKLVNAAGNASVVNPSVATLYISDDDGSLIIPAGTALVSETISNGVIDPGETLTLLFGFRNSGGLDATNLTATLLATNNVIPVTSTQTYGAMPVGGHVVSRPFTFTANGTNGQTLVATFLLRDNGDVVGTGLFTFSIGSTTVSLTNAAPIIITDRASGSPLPAAATPYPSTISVGGVGGTIGKVTVGISNLTDLSLGDVGMLLVSPAGQKTLLMANAGGFNPGNNLNLTFDDAASDSLPFGTAFGSGSYKPTAYAMPVLPTFPSPAPSSGYSNYLAAFNGSNPNGIWSLFVIDDTFTSVGGVISNGWSLSITRSSLIPANADLSLAMTASPEPVVAGTQLTYILRVTNFGPATASAVSVSDTLPAGAQFVSATPGTGSVTNQAGVVTWSVGALANGASASLSLVIIPTTSGLATNTAVASSSVTDVYVENNTATTVSHVNTPTADLAVGMTDSPDPVPAGWLLTYQVTVTNIGPATATSVMVTNKLPVNVNFVSVNSSQGSAGNASGTVWASLGSISSGGVATITLVVSPIQAGAVTNTATASSPVVDPLKANNTASVKTTVVPQLQAQFNGAGITLLTPGVAGSVLDSTTTLMPPVVWTPILTNPPTVLNLPIGSGSQFFRLRAGP